MNMSGESLLVILFVGLIAGWLAGHIVRGTGFGVLGDLVVGIIGAFIGNWLLPRLGIQLGVGLIAAIFDATIGAILLLLLVRLVRGAALGKAAVGADVGAVGAAGAIRAALCWKAQPQFVIGLVGKKVIRGKGADQEIHAACRARGGRRANCPHARGIDHRGDWLRDLLGGERQRGTCCVGRWCAHRVAIHGHQYA